MAQAQSRLDLAESDLPTSFEDILNRPAEDAERPRPIPQGTYEFVIREAARYGTSAQKQTPFVEVTCYPVGVVGDVSNEAITEAGGLSNLPSLRMQLYITDKTEWRLTKFCDDCGIPSREGKRKLSHQERFDMIVNSTFIGHVKHDLANGNIYAKIDSTMPTRKD